MELDRTLIAVHERSLLETFDLSLHVVRQYFMPLVITFAAGAIPLALLHVALVGWILDVEQASSFVFSEEWPKIARYLWDMTVLVFLSAPLASVFATKFLGEAVFVERPRLRSVWKSVFRLSGRIIWCQVLLRGCAGAWLLVGALEREGDLDVSIELFLLGMLTLYCVMLRATRPFINEIVLLECNPLLAANDNEITIGRRSSHLHSPSSGDLVSRWIGSAGVAVLLTGTVFGCFLFLSGVFFNDWRPGLWMLLVVYPLSLWMVAGFVTVVRFLNYLDLRIRHEGWETELLLRAEAGRIMGRAA